MRRTIVSAHLVCLVLASTCALASNYTVRQLPLPAGTNSAWARGVNDSGQVVGFAQYSAFDRWGAFWDTDGTSRLLGATTDAQGARAINNAGDAVGQDNYGGYIWNKSRGYSPLGSLHPWNVNQRGDVVGVEAGAVRPVVRWSDGTVTSIDPPSGCGKARGTASNQSGVVVGEAIADSHHSYPFKWTPGGAAVLLPSLGGAWSWADDINDAGLIVGHSMLSGGGELACLWTSNGVLTTLPNLPYDHFAYTFACAINSAGTIVGQSSSKPVVWEAGTHALIELPMLPGQGSGEAIDISDSGLIVGHCGSIPVIWTPVPEPGSMLALVFGLVGCRFAARRRG